MILNAAQRILDFVADNIPEIMMFFMVIFFLLGLSFFGVAVVSEIMKFF